MRLQLFRITIIGLLATLIASCSSDKATSGKINFPTVEFTISASLDTTIFGEQGTRVFIEKGTFQFADGTPVTDSIKIKIKEFYQKSDIILADLSTESDGKLLETGGMLKITATSKGQEIEIKGDKRIVVHFPKPQDSYKQMNLFFADKSATDSSVTNWDIDTVNLVKRTLEIGSYAWHHPWDDSTSYDFIPKKQIDTGYYWNPLDLYLNAYNFSNETKKEIESNLNKTVYPTLNSWNDYGIECEMSITKEGFIKNPRVNSKVTQSTRKEIIQFLKNLPQLEPGKNKKGEIVERSGLLFIQGGNIVPLYKSREEYLRSFDNKYSCFEKKPIKNIDNAELEYYIFSVAKLGWINCDRFLDSEKLIDYIVQSPTVTDTKIKMVFTDIDGVLMAKLVDGKHVFSKVPVGRQVTIVAIKNADGKFQTAFQKLTIADKPLENLAFKETTLAELKQELEKLN
ncbi:MAG: hypothetical protein V4538_00605 [Bacteroidota bacterium]